MGEGPYKRKVTIEYDFWMGKYEVSQDEYQLVSGNNPVASDFMTRVSADMGIDPAKQINGDAPVVGVSWSEANDFAMLLSNRAKILKKLPDGYVYRLPTEAEWEYCCLAGGAIPNRDPYELHEIAHYVKPYDMPPYNLYSKGSRSPNAWGLFDMLGFVSEWCFDYYAPLGAGALVNPTGPDEGRSRVIKGGYSFDTNTYLASYRYCCPNKSPFRGFRLVMAPSIDSIKSRCTPQTNSEGHTNLSKIVIGTDSRR